jgi:hypothetical protein
MSDLDDIDIESNPYVLKAAFDLYNDIHVWRGTSLAGLFTAPERGAI